MAYHPQAGQPVSPDMLEHIPRLVSHYYCQQPDASQPEQAVSFGTSGHRGSSLDSSFNEGHILAICQALCEYRQQAGITGVLFMGMDTHALSEPAHITAIEVLIANGVELRIAENFAFTPTPVISRAILQHNASQQSQADGIVITPSHNPPRDGGFKYNPPTGGPASGDITSRIQQRANDILANGLKEVKRLAYQQALQADNLQEIDMMTPYIEQLDEVVDFAAMREAGLKLAVDPMGGAAVDYWHPIAERYGLDIIVTNPRIDPTFSFMTVDKDGKIRMDCSSPHAMASLISLKDNYDLAFGNDPDVDRHGIVTRTGGLLNPNHYLAVAIQYLFQHRPAWASTAKVGKTLVSSSMIDRVTAKLGRDLAEVPVGFKYFVDGLLEGSYGFGGEESAGASFLKKDGTVWTTDKDGIIMNLLAAEILAVTGKDPSQHYADLRAEFGSPIYKRISAPATLEQKAILKKLSAEQVTAKELAGESIQAVLTHAPAGNEAIGGVKVVTENGWFAARPSGTEDIYKIYAESFQGEAHLASLLEEAQEIVDHALARD